jgi:hypothetical protein
MREEQQTLKLNISAPNDVRFTLEGAGVIQAYCKDNRIANKPYTAMLKQSVEGGDAVSLTAYDARIKVKREVNLAADDERIKGVLGRWEQHNKFFRSIQRFEFSAPNGIPLRFDVSIVRQGSGRSFQEARVTTQPLQYEVEVELIANRDSVSDVDAMKLIVRGLGWVLQGRQRSFVLITKAG